MIVVVLGAQGGVGRELVRQSLLLGHEVRAVLRQTSSPVTDDPRIRITQLDLGRDTAELHRDLVDMLMGADAVLSALGARTASDHGVLMAAAAAVVAAMRTAGLSRYLGVSAAPVSTVASPGRPHPPRHDPGDDLLTRWVLMPVVHRLFGAGYADAAAMEDTVRASGLDWTLLRPPRLTDKAPTGQYRVAVDQNVRGGRKISRADLAALMLGSIDDRSTFCHSLGVAY